MVSGKRQSDAAPDTGHVGIKLFFTGTNSYFHYVVTRASRSLGFEKPKPERKNILIISVSYNFRGLGRA